MAGTTLVRELQDRYGVGPEYAAAYLAFWNQPGGRHAGQTFHSLDEILSLPAPDSVWFDYALSTNQRARTLCDMALALPEAPASPGRFLDIGCGFGGLLAAFAARGFDVRGIEIDGDRVALAQANCRDQGLTDVVFQGDILDDRLVAGLGQFDVIAMIDVIEHVLDVPKALAHVSRLLAPRGVALLEIPNRRSLRFVAADGHFGLFGITLLDRPSAMAYQQALFAFPYDVGDYLDLEDYRRQLDRLGCDMTRIDSPMHSALPFEDVPDRLRAIDASFAAYRAGTRPKLDPAIDARLQLALAEFTTRLLDDYRRARSVPDARPAFGTEYLLDFWTVAARKRET